MHFDHIIPKSRGGPNGPWNLRIVHAVCNLVKSDHIEILQLPMLIVANRQKAAQVAKKDWSQMSADEKIERIHMVVYEQQCQIVALEESLNVNGRPLASVP